MVLRRRGEGEILSSASKLGTRGQGLDACSHVHELRKRLLREKGETNGTCFPRKE